jgi:hypothetical protein
VTSHYTLGWVDVGTSEYGADLLDFMKKYRNLSPNFRTPNPGFHPSPLYITNAVLLHKKEYIPGVLPFKIIF